MDNLFNVKDLVVVITGGGGILGRGMSEYMCSQGAKVVILDRCREAGTNLEAKLKAKGYEVTSYCTDVLVKESLEETADAIMTKYGRIDVLVNAAGGNMAGATIGPDSTIFDLEIDAFRKVVDLNLFGTVLPTMVFAKIMVQQKKEVSSIFLPNRLFVR